jgi:hypothetical protein
MSSYGSKGYSDDLGGDENEYDSNAEYEFDGNSPMRSPSQYSPSTQNSPKASKTTFRNPKKSSEDSSDSDVEILSFQEGVKKLFVKKKEKNNERFIPGLLTRRATMQHPNIVKLSLADKKVVKTAVSKYVKKTYSKDSFIVDNIDSILAGKISTKDQKIIDKIEDILQIYLEVSKQISLDRSVQKFMMIEKK